MAKLLVDAILNGDASRYGFEAQSHAQYLTPFIPETEEAFMEIAAFFDRHLAV